MGRFASCSVSSSSPQKAEVGARALPENLLLHGLWHRVGLRWVAPLLLFFGLMGCGWGQDLEGGLLIDWRRETIVPMVSSTLYKVEVGRDWALRADVLFAFEVGSNRGELGYGLSLEYRVNRDVAVFGGVAFLDEVRRFRFDEIGDKVGAVIGFRIRLGD
jgi:hypothetical protein